MFNKLQVRLWGAFIFIILFTFSITIGTALTLTNILEEHNKAAELNLEIYEVSVLTSDLTANYLMLLRNIDDASLEKEYASISLEIDQRLSSIDKKLTDENSKAAFIGLKNIITSIQEEFDMGIQAAQKGDLVTSFLIYDEVVKKIYFVDENTSKLLFIEITQTKKIHERLEANTHRILSIESIFIIISIFLCIVFTYFFTQRITRPLKTLTELTKEIQQGHFEFSVPRSITNKKDETGLLANAFDQMKIKVKQSIDDLQKSNQDLQKAQQNLKDKNKELKKINEVMIGREIRMIALKKDAKELEERLKQMEQR